MVLDPQAAPPVAAANGAPALDLLIRWGDYPLAAVHLSPPRSFHVGETEDCDLALPASLAGAERMPILLARWDGDVRLVVPKDARVRLDGTGKMMSGKRAEARGRAKASATVKEAFEVSLEPGQRATLRLGTVTIEVERGREAPRAKRDPLLTTRSLGAHAASLVLHAGLLGGLSMVAPPPMDDEDGGMSVEQMLYMQEKLQAAAEREEEEEYSEFIDALERRAARNARRAQREWAAREAERDGVWMRSLETASDAWSAQLRQEALLEERARTAEEPSLLGLFYEKPPPKPPPPPKPQVFTGYGGTGGTLEAEPEKRARAPQVRHGRVTVSGRLPPEVVARIVRQNYGRFRLCYENGLRDNPNLQGQVGVRFVIGRDGAVGDARNGGSDLPDNRVVQCVVRAFMGLSYPQPESGIVTVMYTVLFSPGG
jgi:hypothetical protein